MYVKEFGEVKIIWGEYPKGFIIRQAEEEIVLEEHFDTENRNVDVIHCFHEDMSLLEKGDFCKCLAKAREYVQDFNVPIHIMKLYPPKVDADETRRDEIKSTIEWAATHPWNPIPLAK